MAPIVTAFAFRSTTLTAIPISDSSCAGCPLAGIGTIVAVAIGIIGITAQVQAGGVFAIAEPLLVSNLKRAMEPTLAEAKALLEREAMGNAR